MSTPNIIRWAARILGLLSIGVLLLFLFGESFDPLRISSHEGAGLIFFPIGLGIGMIAAWRWESVGGAITGMSGLPDIGRRRSHRAKSTSEQITPGMADEVVYTGGLGPSAQAADGHSLTLFGIVKD